MNSSILYLIPSPLGEYECSRVLPERVTEVIASLDTFVVEEVRTARRFLSAAGAKGRIQDMEFHTLNEHTSDEEVEALAALFKDGKDVGLISEAGLPAVADPGARLVDLCHRIGIRVVPLTGPSSLMLALMASGLNGQRFAFKGYLPVKPDARKQALRSIEKRSKEENESQIFIETPYRNDSMLQDILSVCHGSTRLCIACAITTDDEFIMTKSVSEWKKAVPSLGKRPCVFILLARP